MSTFNRLPDSSRRSFIRTMGSLIITIPFLPACQSPLEEQHTIAQTFESLPGSLSRSSKIRSWLEVLADGRVRIFSGKVELGQGIRNAIRQVAAEELYMQLDQVEIILADTDRTPDEGYTAGSMSIVGSAMAIRAAAAAAREQLIGLAAAKLQTERSELVVQDGYIRSRVGRDKLSFADLLDGQQIAGEVPLSLFFKPKSEYQFVGKPIARGDQPELVRGKAIYIHDLQLAGMVHGRVLRPKNYASKLLRFEEEAFRQEVQGLLKIVRNGDFLGVITEREYQAEQAVKLLEKHSEWSRPALFPKQEELFDHLASIAEAPQVVKAEGGAINASAAAIQLAATFRKPYTMHASIGPACGIAHYDGDLLTVWSHSQGIYPLREALLAMLGLERDQIHVISAPGAGCFGHTVADDAAADAAILAKAYPQRPVRVRWSRTDEHRWEPYGSAMQMSLKAGLDASGKLTYWQSDIWTDSHSTRPNAHAGTLLAARHLDPPQPLTQRGYLGGGHRNGDPYYDIPQMRIAAHFFDGPLRVSSLRSLGAFANIFAIESFMDELAEASGQDAIAFRLKHLKDQRAIAVVETVQKQIAGIETDEGEGLGFAFARYKNYSGYCAMAAKVKVDTESGVVRLQQVWAAVDVGEIINPDSLKNQVEGAIVQAAAWTLSEEVTFDEYEITSIDWNTYPIQHFSDAPDLQVTLLDRPDEAAMGGGEVGTPPVAAAICNAIYRAGGQRVRQLPVLIKARSFSKS